MVSTTSDIGLEQKTRTASNFVREKTYPTSASELERGTER